jgi:hypothetical protein
MRMKQVIKGLKNSQRIRVIVDGVGIYMTVGQTESSFATANHRIAVQNTLELMVAENCGGIAHTVEASDKRVAVQVDLV